MDNLTGTIYDIQCIYLGDIMSEPVFRFQDFRSDPDLDALDKPFCNESDDAHRLPCMVNVTRDEMQLIFGVNSFDPCFYYADGRAQYYYKEKGL